MRPLLERRRPSTASRLKTSRDSAQEAYAHCHVWNCCSYLSRATNRLFSVFLLDSVVTLWYAPFPRREVQVSTYEPAPNHTGGTPRVIMYLAPGEPSYLPDGLLSPLHDEAFLDLVPAIRRCVDRQIPWDVVAFLAAATDWCCYQDIARSLGSSAEDALAQLDALVQAGLIEERLLVLGPHYRFGADHRLRSFFRRPTPAAPEFASE